MVDQLQSVSLLVSAVEAFSGLNSSMLRIMSGCMFDASSCENWHPVEFVGAVSQPSRCPLSRVYASEHSPSQDFEWVSLKFGML